MIRPSHWVLCTLLVLCAPLTFADSLLNGLAMHKEFNKDQFIGALYTDKLSADAATQLNDPSTKRLELRIVADRFSTRQLNSMWIEGMAINNPPALLSAQAQQMVAFTTFVQRSLRAGDILAIRGNNKRTSVSVNGIELGVIDSPEFFNMVLRTWIGNVPLSSEFRDQLLTNGEIDSQLLATFENTQPSAARKQAIASWSQPRDEETNDGLEVAAIAAAAALPAPKLEVSMAKPVLTAPVVAAPAPVETVAAAKPEPTKPESSAKSEPSAKPEPPKVEPKPEPTPAPQVAKAPAPANTVAEDDFDDDFDDDEDSAPLLTAESLLSRQMYHSQLLRWTYQNIEYPKRAIDRGHEGSIRLAVVIDRQGKVKNVAEVESSLYSSLNRAARDAVKRSEPFPAIPESIQGEEFAFSLPIQFKMPE